MTAEDSHDNGEVFLSWCTNQSQAAQKTSALTVNNLCWQPIQIGMGPGEANYINLSFHK